MVNVGINGLGTMGRYLLRALYETSSTSNYQDIKVVAVNDLYSTEQLAQTLKHDSVYLGFPGKIEVDGTDLVINGNRISVSSNKNPSDLKWGERGVDVVYESTGAFAKKPGVEGHLKAGAKKVIFSVPSEYAEATIVMGINNDEYLGQDIISNASCTTNCLGPLVDPLRKEYGANPGLMTTIHAYTADQKLVDAPHKNATRGYAAAENLIPTSTGAAKTIGKVIPGLDGKLNGGALRIPTPTVSLVDLVLDLKQDATPEEVNLIMKEAAEGYLKGVLKYSNEPIVSSMMISESSPSVFDSTLTMTQENLAKVFAWYDNISGYSHQALKMIQMVGKDLK